MDRFKRILSIILYIFLISVIISVFIIRYFSYKMKPNFDRYVVSELERIISLIINDTISSDLINEDAGSFFIKNNSDNINTIDLNNKKINMIQNNINRHIEDNIRLISNGDIEKIDKYFNTISEVDYELIKGGIVYYVTSGNLSGNIFTNNLGPKIPIRFNMSGDVISNIDSRVREYGINNALIEVSINIKVNMIVYMPYVSKKVTVNTSTPIVSRIIQGSIPDYYMGR